MDDQPLAEVLSSALEEVAELEERDRAGRAHTEVKGRLTYLHQLLGTLEAELGALRRAAGEDQRWKRVWRDTAAELRARAPSTLRAPAAALTAGDLDLLRLVEYTAASIALVQERRSALRRLAPPDAAGGETPSSA